MIKELLIAGLMSSVASTHNDFTTHYINDTQYEQLRCNEFNLKDTHVSYTQYKDNDIYEPMEQFLGKYKSSVLDLLDKSHEDQGITQKYHDFLVDALQEEIFENLLNDPLHKISYYVSFTITDNGHLIFEKPCEFIT